MLKEFASYVTYGLIKLDQGSRLGDAIEFFIYDTIKIFLLLLAIILLYPSSGVISLLKRQEGSYRIKKNL